LKRLETWLGDDHDLVLLRATILDAPRRFGTDQSTAQVLGSIARYQATLRGRALGLGERMFVHRARVFRKSVEGWLRG
jgi:hypothetical protein